MGSDYAAIREQSREKYGSDISNYGPTLLANLYSTRTHFIFELLQNAEDAKASRIVFRLNPQGLEVRHNGKPFTPTDVNSICSIARSSKRENLNSIGKFGIGFKAVYAYTNSPTVHSADEHFTIKDFVHPHAAEPVAIAPQETLFYFPFDHHDISPDTAHGEIKRGLLQFESRSLLFLKNLEQLEVEVSQRDGIVQRFLLKRELKKVGDMTTQESLMRVILRKVEEVQGTQSQRKEDWLRLEANGDHEGTPYRVSVAFKMTQENQSLRIVPVEHPPVFVYFPTEKYLSTGFLLQGPFRTTPARDNIPGEDPWNLFLVQQIARIARRAFLLFAKNKLLDVKTLECLPIRKDDSSLYQPIYQELLEMARSEAIFPVEGEGYARASQCYAPRGEELRKLFPTAHLRALTGKSDLNWAAPGVTADPELAKYWRDNDILQVVEPGDLMAHLSEAFLANQTDDWMSQFYLYLVGHRALLKGELRNKPILRTEMNQHMWPHDSLGSPRTYLPGDTPTDFPTLKRCLAKDPQIRTFFSQNFNLKEPGILDILNRFILPQYQAEEPTVSVKENQKHLELILKSIKSDGRIREYVQEKRLLRTSCGWSSPRKTYVSTEELHTYFAGNSEVAFAAADYAREGLEQLGCASRIRLERRPPGPQNYVRIRSNHGDHARGVDGFDPDFLIDGLEWALTHPTPERSRILWNEVLVHHSHCLEGVVEQCSQQAFPAAKVARETTLSKAGKLLSAHAWLPDRQGQLRKPAEISLSELAEGFQASEALAQKLKMKVSAVADLALQQGVDPEVLHFALNNPEVILAMQQQMARDKLELARREREKLDYSARLEDSFERPATAVASDEFASSGRVANPELRRSRLQEDLLRSQESDPARISRSHRRTLDAADDSVRAELRGYYQGQCQICQDGFLKRDGTPYFEAVHLIGRSQAAWLDTIGNLLCLCANCSARWQHGSLNSQDLIQQILEFRCAREGGSQPARLLIQLCGQARTIHYVEKHLLALQVLVSQNQEAPSLAH